MPIQIEGQSLVANHGWRKRWTRKEHLRDGLISHSPERKVRVRIRDDHATIAIKTKKSGIKDAEFEYEIPVATAMAGDLGSGIFDSASLVSNFESLNPANTYRQKARDIYSKVDTAAARFLEFETWWGNPVLLSAPVAGTEYPKDQAILASCSVSDCFLIF